LEADRLEGGVTGGVLKADRLEAGVTGAPRAAASGANDPRAEHSGGPKRAALHADGV